MCDKSGAIDLQHEDVVHHPYLLAIDKLHHPLMAQHIDLQANTSAGIHMPALGEELDVKRLALYVLRSLRMNVARNLLLAPGVYPLPFLREHTEIGIALSVLCHRLILSSIFAGSSPRPHLGVAEVVIIAMTMLLLVILIRRERCLQESV